MKTVYFDLVCGASGDMILSSLISLGFPVELLEQQLNQLGIGEIRIGVEKVKRNGISCTYITPAMAAAHPLSPSDRNTGNNKTGCFFSAGFFSAVRWY
jgi:uncharacterized protein (DUF111 family)